MTLSCFRGEGGHEGSILSVVRVYNGFSFISYFLSIFRLQIRQVHQFNERRRIFEDNLAAVCMGFVLVFLMCHLPRLMLNIHELITIEVSTDLGSLF